jgi:hypothetical protein
VKTLEERMTPSPQSSPPRGEEEEMGKTLSPMGRGKKRWERKRNIIHMVAFISPDR